MAPNKIDATIIILTKNEERHIARAIKSSNEFAQVLVIDSASTDGTVALAEQNGARVLGFEWNGRYPKKKEWALKAVSTDWVFYLDADEFFCADLVREIRTHISNPAASAVEVPLRYFWMGRELRHGHRVTKRIGFRRSKGFWPRPNDLQVKNMWEVEGHYQPQVREGAIVQCTFPLGHLDEDGLYDYFARHNRYSDWEAHMLFNRDQASLQSRSTLGRLAVRLPGKPVIFFCYSYFARLGLLDGLPGFHYALALSFYYWQIGLKTTELQNAKTPESRGAISLPEPGQTTS